MTTRREINSKHESAVIGAALHAHNERMGGSFQVELRPDPPDAILVDGNRRPWIEHTDAFYPGWAEDLTSFAASDKIHRPMRRGPHLDMDNQVAGVFAKVVIAKFNNKSYQSVVNQYGPGILVVGIESPWLDDETVHAITEHWAECGGIDLSSVFRWVYLGFRLRGENKATLWEPSS
jgi:hypothetical protein